MTHTEGQLARLDSLIAEKVMLWVTDPPLLASGWWWILRSDGDHEAVIQVPDYHPHRDANQAIEAAEKMGLLQKHALWQMPDGNYVVGHKGKHAGGGMAAQHAATALCLAIARACGLEGWET